MMDKIKASKPYQMYERFKTWKTYHFIQALLSYIALITLLASLGLLNNPPEFPYPTQESDIKSATEFNAGKPNNSPLFRKLAGITGNEKMKIRNIFMQLKMEKLLYEFALTYQRKNLKKLLESMRSRNSDGIHFGTKVFKNYMKKVVLMRLYWHTMVDVMMGQFTLNLQV